jgi:hypothetical protein
MHRLFLTSAATALVFLALASPAWAAWVWPLSGEVITPYSNGDDPYASGQHRGIDIAGETGQPVAAAAAGSVRFAGTAGSSGLTVSIRTLDGFDTSYLHLSSASVREGESVTAGERIGAVGTSGTRSTERAHLHFGVREAGSRHAYRDPLAFLPALPPAAESPREASAPQPTPEPVAPAPAPLSNGERAPAARRGPVRQPVPAGRRATAGGRVSSRAGALATQPVRQAAPAAPPASVPQATPASSARHGLEPHSARGPEHRSERIRRFARGGPDAARPASPPADTGAGRHAAPAAATPPDRPPVEAKPRGPDFGLLLACVGLLGAAALIGLSENGRAATRRSGRRAAGLLRPLLTRR